MYESQREINGNAVTKLRKCSIDLSIMTENPELVRFTWGMMRFQSPIPIRCVCNYLIVPLDLQMAWCLLEARRTGERLYIKLRFWWHCENLDWRIDCNVEIEASNR